MSDRELLELAAKAAAVEIHSWHEEMPRIAKKQNRLVYWNPLTDDGDALRLAVKLKIDLYLNSNMVETAAMDNGFYSETYGDDPYAATRRAIVRAAAEIGKEQA